LPLKPLTVPIVGSARSFSFAPSRAYKRIVVCASVIQLVTNWLFTMDTPSSTSFPGASGITAVHEAGAGFVLSMATRRYRGASLFVRT
jgi:hypothetical protein